MIVETMANKSITNNSDTFKTVAFNMPKSNRGIVSFEVDNWFGTVISSITVSLEGRLSSEVDFVAVKLTDSATVAVLNDTTDVKVFEDIQMFPEMRVNVTATTGLTSCSFLAKVSN